MLDDIIIVFLHDNQPNPLLTKQYLLGEWKMHSTFGRLPNECSIDDFITFKSDGSFEYNWNKICADSSMVGTWKLDETSKKITAQNYNLYRIYTIRNLTENYLDLYDDLEETIYIFKKDK